MPAVLIALATAIRHTRGSRSVGTANIDVVVAREHMRMRLEHDVRFEAAHWLPRVPEGHRCRRVHGHSYQLVVVVEGEVDPEMGWVVDYYVMQEAVMPVVGALDHRLLN